MKPSAARSAKSPVARRRGADDVVIGERAAIVAVRVGEGVTDPRAAGPDGTVRTLCRKRLERADQTRLRQKIGETAAGGVWTQGGAAVDLLILDELRARRTDPLDDQVEAIGIALGNAVVVD